MEQRSKQTTDRRGRGGKAVDDGEDEEVDLVDSGPRGTRKGTVGGATAKNRAALVSPAVGYRIEGGGLSEDDQTASSSPPSKIIDDVFDLEGKDNDHKFYQTKFVDKGASPPNVTTQARYSLYSLRAL